jgi:hypothetical protein
VPGRQPNKFVLEPEDEAFLHELLRHGETPWRVVRRAQILLGRANEQQRVVRLGDKVDVDEATIWRVCDRYQQGGLQAALYDAPRSGRPRVFFPRRTQSD